MEVQIWQCLNKKCGKTFPLVSRITRRITPQNIYEGILQETTEFFCCPYCKTKEFKPFIIVVEAKKEE